ncbi:hypothetical protein GCK72_009359 [Caenorhabditis remanei]|uniref:TRPM-like domain-containing protein n=1 Tax=Caenorhabditis remanei TaxID=31234 RepID=A0A6A5H2C5_CAERE|nr:hypothetical protein GCK72_009359 [Caenorhabditis remanei]KAF1761105.1 hypothetical protein GCK72_009359 [Caenorhabditis remanei]
MDESDPANVPDMSLLPDTVPVVVSADGSDAGIQLCPALILGSPQALPGATKHIYSRLAAAASEVDQGVPDIIISLISHGNSLSTKYMSSVENGLKSFLIGCGTWIISSGEVNDPLSRVASGALKNVLPQLEHQAEVLHILVNSDDVIASDSTTSKSVVDTSLNTLMLICRKEANDSSETIAASIAKLRAATAVKLAHPPPALLIGVPSEPMSPSTYGNSAAILLSPSNDKRPFPVAVFAGASKESLIELLFFVEHGIPVVILQDSCELCAILHSSHLLLETSNFDNDKFVSWLRSQLYPLGLADCYTLITKLLISSTSGDVQLIEFIDSSQLSELSSVIVDRCLECYATTGEERQVLLLAAKLNCPSVLSSMDVAAQLDEELLTMILCECITKDDQLHFLSSVLQLNPPIRVTSNMLIRMMYHADEHFFTTIVLCQSMGYSYIPSEIDPRFANDIQKLVKKLSFGVNNLFDPNVFCNDSSHRDKHESIKILAIWSLLLHRPGIVKCLAAFADEPVAFSMVLSRISRSLAHESHDWHFYEKSLNELSDSLSASATQLFDTVFTSSPAKAYQLLCQPMEHFYEFNITQLAYHCNARDIIAHECCQRWVHRKLYGNLQAKNFPTFIPKWAKFCISAILVIPVKFWMLVRPRDRTKQDNSISPTVALLDVGKFPQKQRAISTYSVISSRSEALTALTAPLSTAFGFNSALGGAESATPQSMVFPLNIEEIEKDSRPFGKKNRIRRAHAPTLSTFYSTPIVKYWLSLLFRIIYICCLAYSVVLPGCGSNVWDTGLWVWSFIWWIESLYVLTARTRKIPLLAMPWRTFDVFTFGIFLILLLMMKVLPAEQLLEYVGITSTYPAKVVSAFFVLYVSYSTLFTYIPLSDIFGPMIVRVKLMLLRDFTNFLCLVALVMLSSGVAIQAVVFPDRPVTIEVLKKTMSWIWLSLFTTDLSNLNESDTCRKSFIGAPQRYCTSVGQYANNSCPAQSLPAYLIIIELRPPLPPPLTILCLICSACCRFTNSFTGFFSDFDHPDFEQRDKNRTTWRFGSIYRNPSVPFKKNDFVNSFWRKLSMEQWRNTEQKPKTTTTNKSELQELHNIHNHIRMMTLRDSYEKSGTRKASELQFFEKYPESSIMKISVNLVSKPWAVLVPRYNPPFYCKPSEDFTGDVQKYVDVATEQNVGELKRIWRSRQANDVTSNSEKCWRLSAAGFPLNPNGRTGMAGRGNHPRFGANRRCYYIVLSGGVEGQCQVLVDSQKNVPNEWHLENSSKDEHLTSILKMIGVSDSDAHMFSMRRLDSTIVTADKRIPSNDTSPAHLASEVAENENDTDNAWTEHDVWAISLRERRILTSIIGYSWLPTSAIRGTILPWQADLVFRAKTIYGL